ncbi:TonB-dependent receptor [Allohahella marinimesophila]|uniref:TonB-dependent receptor PqqU n=1 Tax=Allohahella marinimesophila TaxID=1054972 RepID=A0ABP7PHI8_9GAMM
MLRYTKVASRRTQTLRFCLLAGVIPQSPVALAEATAVETDDTIIIVTTPRMQRTLYDTPAATSVIDGEDIQKAQQRLKLDEVLAGVPGVALQNRENFAQGERVSIRGFGARAPFGVRGITVLVDGIPYTLPDGQAQLDAIDLDSAQRIEIIRGPASVLYGNAAGGVISVQTADGRLIGDRSSMRLTGGSDGFGKVALNDSGSSDQWAHHIGLSALHSDGFRDHSEVDKYLLNGKVRRALGSDRALTAIVNLLDNPRAEDPGALTSEQVALDRQQAGRFTEAFDTGQRVDQQVLGLQYEDLSVWTGQLYLKTFYLQRNFEQQLPYPGDSLINYNREYYGVSTEFHDALSLASLPFRYVAGMEARRQADDRQRRDVSFEGNIGELSEREFQSATALGIFTQADVDVSEALTLSGGARFDRIRLSIDDDFRSDGDQSGQRVFREWSWSTGLSYRYQLLHQAYANISTAFETPTFSEFANPTNGGGFNPGVDAQQARNHELGLRGRLGYQFDYDLTLFWVDVRDELVPFELNDNTGRTFYRNAGDTVRKGLEVAVSWRAAPAWRVETALTLARYTFEDYRVDGRELEGKRLPGLPERLWNTELMWSAVGERFLALETRYVGSLVADDANDIKVDEYWLVDLRGGDGWRMGSSAQLKTFAGIRNLLDEDYYANVRINAGNGRYFEPAAGRTFYAGVELEL